MSDQLALPEDDSVTVGTARVRLLPGPEWHGMRRGIVTEEGAPGGDWCGRVPWAVGTRVLI